LGGFILKTEPEIQSVFDYLCTNDEEDLCGYGNDLPYIENTRAFKEALLWVMKPNASQSGIEADAESRCPECGEAEPDLHCSNCGHSWYRTA